MYRIKRERDGELEYLIIDATDNAHVLTRLASFRLESNIVDSTSIRDSSRIEWVGSNGRILLSRCPWKPSLELTMRRNSIRAWTAMLADDLRILITLCPSNPDASLNFWFTGILVRCLLSARDSISKKRAKGAGRV